VKKSVDMAIIMRAYEARDAEHIPYLLVSQSSTTPHLLDLSWRLGSHYDLPARGVAVWEDENRELLGLAAWQQPWAALDFFVRPGAAQHEVEEQFFAWAIERFQALD
jgi:hypothetical protein